MQHSPNNKVTNEARTLGSEQETWDPFYGRESLKNKYDYTFWASRGQDTTGRNKKKP